MATLKNTSPLIIVGILALALFLFYNSPTSRGNYLAVAPYQTKITFMSGEVKTITNSPALQGLMIVEGGGDASSISQDFMIKVYIYKDGQLLTDVPATISYTIKILANGKEVGSPVSGTVTAYSGSYAMTDFATITQTTLRNAVGSGKFTLTFSCSASATASPTSGVTLHATNSGSTSFSVDLSDYSMKVVVS